MIKTNAIVCSHVFVAVVAVLAGRWSAFPNIPLYGYERRDAAEVRIENSINNFMDKGWMLTYELHRRSSTQSLDCRDGEYSTWRGGRECIIRRWSPIISGEDGKKNSAHRKSGGEP